MMGPEQKALFRETQAVMSLLEGFSDYVMDEVGKDLVPDVERISARFHERRTRRTPFERAVLRLTGMDLKMEQYKKGERFVRAIADDRPRFDACERVVTGVVDERTGRAPAGAAGATLESLSGLIL